MNPTLRRLTLACLAVSSVAMIASACSSKKGGADPRCDEEVVPFEGYATDEACKSMLDAEDAGRVQVGTTNAPALVLPSNGSSIAATASSLNITWTSPIELDGDTFLLPRRAPKARALAQAPSLARELVAMLAPVSTAWAHLPPMTGTLHRVRIKGIAGRSTPFVAFTTKLHFAVTGTNLAPILATTTPMQIELSDAYLTENRIATPSTDGPFRPASDRIFQVQ